MTYSNDISPADQWSPITSNIPRVVLTLVGLTGVIAILALCAQLYATDRAGIADTWIVQLALEDGPLEWIQASGYFIAILVCIAAAVRGQYVFLAVLWGCLSFLFLGEELSWGQRIFGFSVPGVEAINYQNEFNFHNLDIMAAPGLSEAQSLQDALRSLLGAQQLFQMGFYGYFFALPVLLMAIPFLDRIASLLGYIKPTVSLIILSFIVIFSTYLTNFLIDEQSLKDTVVELREIAFAATIAVYSVQTFTPAPRKPEAIPA